MPLNDHVLLLQLERTVEVLSDSVEDAVNSDDFADVDHDHDESYAHYNHDHDEIYADVEHVHPGLGDDIDDLGKDLDEHERRIEDIEKRAADNDSVLHQALTEITAITSTLASQLERAILQIGTQREMITALYGRVTVAEQALARLQSSTDARFNTAGEMMAMNERRTLEVVANDNLLVARFDNLVLILRGAGHKV